MYFQQALQKYGPNIISLRIYRFLDQFLSRFQRKQLVQFEIDHSETPPSIIEARRNGFARWDNFLSADELALFQSKATEYTNFAEIKMKDTSDRTIYYDDPDRGCQYSRSNWFEITGRDRAVMSPRFGYPEFLKSFIHTKKLDEIGLAYFGIPCDIFSVLFERYRPAKHPEHEWHFDSPGDEFKLMILLSDTQMESGPVRYKQFSHLRPKEIYPLYHLSYRYGQIYHNPSGYMVEHLPGGVLYGMGRAGDAVLFDTSGIHSSSPIESGERLVVVFQYRPRSLRNKVLGMIGSRFF